jgi:hypothetical protein
MIILGYENRILIGFSRILWDIYKKLSYDFRGSFYAMRAVSWLVLVGFIEIQEVIVRF